MTHCIICKRDCKNGLNYCHGCSMAYEIGKKYYLNQLKSIIEKVREDKRLYFQKTFEKPVEDSLFVAGYNQALWDVLKAVGL